MATSIEFVRLGGYPVKVTSLARDEESGIDTLVVITRGSADRNHLDDLLARSPLTFEVPGDPLSTVTVESVDARSVGDGEQAITRFAIRLAPGNPAPDAANVESRSPSVEERLGAIEKKLDLVLQELACLQAHARAEGADRSMRSQSADNAHDTGRSNDRPVS